MASTVSTSAAAATSTNAIPNLHGGANPATPKLAGIVCGSSIAFAWAVCFAYWWWNRRLERMEEAELLAQEERGEKKCRRKHRGETRAKARERREKREKAKKLKKEQEREERKAKKHHHHESSSALPPSASTFATHGASSANHDGFTPLKEQRSREEEDIEDLYRRGLLTR